MSKPVVSIVMGSDSDLDIMREAAKALEEFGIGYEIDVTSAHRSPDRTADYARKAAGRGIRVIIAGAGGAAHLAGVIAAHTTVPVIGVPIPSTSLNGMDSLLATVQMPGGIPVATMAIDKAGAVNAAAFGTCTRVNHHPVDIAFTCRPEKDTSRNVYATGEFVDFIGAIRERPFCVDLRELAADPSADFLIQNEPVFP